MPEAIIIKKLPDDSGGNGSNYKILMGQLSGSLYDTETVSIPSLGVYHRYNVTGAYFPNCTNIGSSAFRECLYMSIASFPKCVDIGTLAFYSCYSLTTTYFPKCETIGMNAFYTCSNLTEANFPECKSIGQSAFQYCGLTTASFPKCTDIGGYAFQYCYSLTSINFPECTVIGTDAFRACSALSVASFPNCTSLGARAFTYCSNLTTVNFPSVSRTENDVFASNPNLETAYLDSCSVINQNAFLDCLKLSYVSLPNLQYIYPYSTTKNQYGTFRSTILTSIELPKLLSLGANTFVLCKSLSTALLPSCNYIGSWAFQSCSTLQSVYLLASSVASLANTNVFQTTPMSDSTITGNYGSIYVPLSLVEAYKSATNWSVYSDRIVGYTE